MNRPNRSNLRFDGSSRRLATRNDDDSRSQIDSESSEEERSSLTEDKAPSFVQYDNVDAENYVEQLRKTRTADDISGSALKTGASILAIKTGVMYLARFGPSLGNKAEIVDDDDIGGGAVAATKLTPSQQNMLNQMAPQASGAAAGGIAAPMMSVVVPTPLGSVMASSASATTAATTQLAVVATAAASVAAAATVAAGRQPYPIPIFPSELQNGTIPTTYIHETGKGVKREYLSLLEQSFEEAYVDMFRETVIAAAFTDCLDELEAATINCLVVCEYPDWCCDLLKPGVVECPFGCSFVRPNGVSVFEISGAFAYEIN